MGTRAASTLRKSAAGEAEATLNLQQPQKHAPYLPSDILSDAGRIFRPSVQRWSPALASRFRRPVHPVATPAYTYEVCALANSSSLLFAMAGQSDFAERICEKQLAWLQRRMLGGEGAHAASLAIQPWVNIGRLYRQRGQISKALAQFDAISPVRDDATLDFGPFRLPISDVLFEDVDLLYAVDSLRTYHAAREYEQGLRFIRRMRPRCHSMGAIARLDEYEFLLLLCRGYWKAAERVLERRSWHNEPQLMLVAAFYRCIILQLRDGNPTSIVTDLSNWARGRLTERPAPDHCVLRFVLELARFSAQHISVELAAGLIQSGYDESSRHEDVPLRVEFSKLAAGMGGHAVCPAVPPPESILASSNYAGFARRFAFTMQMSPDAERALANLRDALQEVLS